MRYTDGLFLVDDQWQALRCGHEHDIHTLNPIDFDTALPRFLPAPVDLHVHGGGGADVMDGPEAICQVLCTHARHGTGALLATSVTADIVDLDRFLSDVAQVMRQPPDAGARLLGAHLEGPFINAKKLGAQPPMAAALDLNVMERWFQTGVVRVITYAPELDPGGCVPALCARYGVRAQLGHTLCNWAQAHTAIQQGAGVTHLYNAMSGVSHRDGGAALAALAYAPYAEVITDGVHVDKAAFDLAYTAIAGLYSVTDATAAAGMPDGDYHLGPLSVSKIHDRVVLADGTLAGSCLTQHRSLQLLRQWGLSWSELAALCSARPARWVNEPTLGCIKTGALAQWLELDDDQPVAVWFAGQRQFID